MPADLSVLDGVRAQIQQIQALTTPLSQTVVTDPAAGGSFSSVLDAVQTAASLPADQTAMETALGSGIPSAQVAGGPQWAGAPSGSLASGSTPSGGDVVSEAEQFLGVPYQWGGTDPSRGLDCSGLVQLAYGRLGIALPRTSQEQQQVGTPVPSLAQARPGDLIFYGSPAEHVGIYVGNGRMINAPHTGTDVRIDSVGTPTSIRRVVGGSAPAALAHLSASAAGGALGSVPPALAPLFLASAARYGLSPQLLAAVAKVESGFDPGAVSPAGAEGLMQLMPSTAASLGVDPLDPAQAVDGAARLLAQNLNQFGSVPLALAAYNAGGGAVKTYGGVPPFPETQNYVQKVLVLAQGGVA